MAFGQGKQEGFIKEFDFIKPVVGNRQGKQNCIQFGIIQFVQKDVGLFLKKK